MVQSISILIYSYTTLLSIGTRWQVKRTLVSVYAGIPFGMKIFRMNGCLSFERRNFLFKQNYEKRWNGQYSLHLPMCRRHMQTLSHIITTSTARIGKKLHRRTYLKNIFHCWKKNVLMKY